MRNMKQLAILTLTLALAACCGPDEDNQVRTAADMGYRINDGGEYPETKPPPAPDEESIVTVTMPLDGIAQEMYGEAVAAPSNSDTRCTIRLTEPSESRWCVVPMRTQCVEFEIAPSVPTEQRARLYDAMQYVFQETANVVCFVEREWSRQDELIARNTDGRLHYFGERDESWGSFDPTSIALGTARFRYSEGGSTDRAAFGAARIQVGRYSHMLGVAMSLNTPNLITFGYTSSTDKYKVVLHELGHSLGLAHNPDHVTVMTAGLSGEDEFSPGELALLKAFRAQPTGRYDVFNRPNEY